MPGRVAKLGSRDRLCARPLRISSPFHVDGAYPSAGVAVAVAGGQRQTRTENTAQAACLDHRQPSDPGRRPKPSFLLLTAFRLPLSFSPSLSLTLLPLCHPLLPATPPLPSRPHQPSLLPPLAPRPSRRRTPPRPPPPPLRLPLLRLSVSSSRGELRYSRKAHVSARIAVACTRRYASSSTFVTSQPPRTLRLLLAAVPFSLSLSPSNLSSSTSSPLPPAPRLPSPPPLVRVAPHFGTQLPLVVETFSRILPRGVYPPVPRAPRRPLLLLLLLLLLLHRGDSPSLLLSLPVSHLRSPPRKGPKKGADSGGSTESGGGGGVARGGGGAAGRRTDGREGEGRHELRVCVAFLCLSSRDFYDLGGSTSARSGKGDGGWNRPSKSRRYSLRYARVHASRRQRQQQQRRLL